MGSSMSIGEAIKESLRWSYQKIEDSFFETYEQQLKLGNKRIRSVGSCAITAVVHNDKVYLANSGDSQAIFLLSDGSGIRSQKANERLSVNCRYERERLRKEWADSDKEIVTEENGAYYLKGRLQPTRTLGDYYLKREQYYQGPGQFKGPYLHCTPDVVEHQLTTAHRYLVVASDGVWDSLTKNQVAQALLREREIDLSKTCYDLDEEEPPFLGSVLSRIL
jgi:pyruvate dehydrogenase phosphatase